MSVITFTELGEFMRFDVGKITANEAKLQNAIDLAELMVASELGSIDMAKNTVTDEDVTIKTSRNRITIKQGVLRVVTALTVDGVVIDLAEIQTSYWMLAYTQGFHFNARVIFSYDHGYDDKADMPDRLSNGILMTGEWVYGGGDKKRDMSSERIGDYAVGFDRGRQDFTIPRTANLLIETFKSSTR